MDGEGRVMKDEIVLEVQRKRDSHASVLKEYYARYLTDVRNLSKSSVKHYFDALNNISRRLKAKKLVQTDIYEIGDLKQLLQIREILFADSDFIELNERGRRMYSAGLNKWRGFSEGKR
jgi:5-methylcytosine-specific restriction protein A